MSDKAKKLTMHIFAVIGVIAVVYFIFTMVTKPKTTTVAL